MSEVFYLIFEVSASFFLLLSVASYKLDIVPDLHLRLKYLKLDAATAAMLLLIDIIAVYL